MTSCDCVGLKHVTGVDGSPWIDYGGAGGPCRCECHRPDRRAPTFRVVCSYCRILISGPTEPAPGVPNFVSDGICPSCLDAEREKIRKRHALIDAAPELLRVAQGCIGLVEALRAIRSDYPSIAPLIPGLDSIAADLVIVLAKVEGRQ